MILLIQISNFWQSDLVPTILVFELIKIMLASSYNIYSIIWVPWLAYHSVAVHAHQVGRLVGAVADAAHASVQVVLVALPVHCFT